MAQDFLLPDIGEGIIECELVEWLVVEGERVVEDQPVADVMTDKALVQIPSMHNGVVTRLYYKKGEIAKVHAPLFSIEADDIAAVEASSSDTVLDGAMACSGLIKEFNLPDIGEGIVECEVVDWFVQVGDVIEEDQPIADVMTDKALVQIPAMETGVITELFCKKGGVAKVHAPLFSYRVSGSEGDDSVAVQADTQISSVASQRDRTVNNQKALASPAVRRVARELNIDLSQVTGSGKNGRVYKEDVMAFNDSTNTSSNIGASVSSEHTTVEQPLSH